MKSKIVGLFLISLFFTTSVYSQTSDTTLVQIETRDGNEFVGKIVRENSLEIVLSTEKLGEITIKKTEIKSRELILPQQIKEGKLWFPNPQSTRYFWAPNGYGLKKGEGYYQNIWVLWNQFIYGLSDNFSAGAGVIPLFLFAGGPTPVFATLKVSVPVEKDKISLGAGTIVGTVLGESTGAFGILYGTSTFGSPDNNISLGLGYGFADGEFAKSPLINFSGLFRISSRGYVLTENYYLNVDGESGGVISVGGRWIIKKAALDFALAIPLAEGMDALIAVPLLGFTIPFGDSKH
jgi:hypothetical protein